MGEAVFHLLTASMKGMVALTGLEAVSNSIQFMFNEDAGIVKWGKHHLPRLDSLWQFYGGRSGIGRFVQTSFLFYGGLTTLFLAVFAIRFNVFDGTGGRTLVGNLAFIGFNEIPRGNLLFWAYQLLAVTLLAAASMTAFQDLQATAWRDVAIGEMPEIVVYRNRQGAMASIVEWQSMRMQEYRYGLLIRIARLLEVFGVRRPVRYEPPIHAGDYDHALHIDHPDAPSFLTPHLTHASPAPAGSNGSAAAAQPGHSAETR